MTYQLYYIIIIKHFKLNYFIDYNSLLIYTITSILLLNLAVDKAIFIVYKVYIKKINTSN
ncbi:MAG: hypothetical protein CM15mP83_1700 [Flavobacteriaceae bacterium]|nr:MAG: hypothetical protein CM15mP83_1700 [Flavobacteriaceae bacterium]